MIYKKQTMKIWRKISGQMHFAVYDLARGHRKFSAIRKNYLRGSKVGLSNQHTQYKRYYDQKYWILIKLW